MEYSKKVKIKYVENGWLVSYDNWFKPDSGKIYYNTYDSQWYGVGEIIKKGFTYNSGDEKEETWNALLKFLNDRLRKIQ